MDVAAKWGPILTVADVMVALPIVLATRAGLFPRWLGILAAVFAIEQLIETVTIVGGSGQFISPGTRAELVVLAWRSREHKALTKAAESAPILRKCLSPRNRCRE
jgi:hypothetical protein